MQMGMTAAVSRVIKNGECRGAKPLWRGSGGVPQTHFLLGRGVARAQIAFFSTQLGPDDRYR